MAELFTIAGAAITIPGILSAAGTVLKAAYDLYGSVIIRKEQLKILLERCRYLIQMVSEILEKDPQISDSLMEGVHFITRTCESVKHVAQILSEKGFLWCVVNTDKIDTKIVKADRDITDAFKLFDVIAQIDGAKFQNEMLLAREQDQAALSAQLQHLSHNDQLILKAIQDQSGVHRRMEELLVVVLKALPKSNGSRPEDIFMKNAAAALQRRSQLPNDFLQDWMLSSLEVEFDDSEHGKIGEGSFGQIFKGEWNGALVAIKRMYREDARALSTGNIKAIRKEIKIWAKLRHPHILPLYGACLKASMPFLVAQYCGLGNICQYLKIHSDHANRVDLSCGVISALLYLHHHDIVHADLKGVNVLVGDNHQALLTDFGLSLVLDDIRSQSAVSSHAGPRGTLRWMAPECLDGDRPDKASDIYSLGITIWEIFSEDIPYAAYTDRVLTRVVVDQKKRPSRPKRLTDDDIWDIVQRCWEPDPTSRPSVDTVHRSLKGEKPSLGTILQPPTERLSLFETTTLPKHGQPQSSVIKPANGRSTMSTQQSAKWMKTVTEHPPRWIRGNPASFLDAVVLPLVPDKLTYEYRVLKGDEDLGIQPTYEIEPSGSQRINLLEYNKGYGVPDRFPIKIFAIDPKDGSESLVAEYIPSRR